MGYNFTRMDDGEEWTCNRPLWDFLLDSARAKGWQPTGTYKIDEVSGDEDPAWDPNDYHSNSGQGVMGNDVESMVSALKLFDEQECPKGVEKEIISGFIRWAMLDDEYPGFEIY